MSEMAKVLKELKLLREDFEKRLGKIENRLIDSRKRMRRTEDTLYVHECQIKELTERLSKLEPIWESPQDGRYALDRSEVYAQAHKCGMSKYQALAALDEKGVLFKHADGRRTASVKLNNKAVRAVVLFGEDWL